jgi:hypothetical protein
MNKRTFGIELELVSPISPREVGERINRKFQEAGFDHEVSLSSFYRRTTNSRNRTVWEIKPDSSIREPDVCRETPHGMEIVSPVLRGAESFKYIKVVTDVLAEVGAKVGVTTGFHVHHGVAAAELKKVAKSWTKIQEAIYKLLPKSRRTNRYCCKWGASYSGYGNLREWYRRHVGTRYVGLNLESYWIRGTVEFRMAAGTVEYDKIVNWIVYTNRLLAKAAELGASREVLKHEEINEILLQELQDKSHRADQKLIRKYIRQQNALGNLIRPDEILGWVREEMPTARVTEENVEWHTRNVALIDDSKVTQELRDAILWVNKRREKFKHITK